MFEPENEMGVVVLFAQRCQDVGFEIISIQAAFPDAIVKRDDIEYRAEFEYLASNFDQHGHDPREADLIICWRNDSGNILPVLALSESGWGSMEIVLPSKIEREAAYWKQRALQAERKVHRMENRLSCVTDDESCPCPYCEREFSKPQGLSAHLRHCDAYQAHKAQEVAQ